MNETKYWLWLSMVFGTGSRRIWEAMCLYETPEEAYRSLPEDSKVLKLSDKELNNIRNTDISQAVKLIGQCESKGIGVVGYSSSLYPPQLRHIFNPPAVIYYKGNISCLIGTRTVTSVGTRKASDYGLHAASEICRELANNNVIIVSGFALGIDIASHLAAAEAGRPTACVMGCGVDVDYPKPNFPHRDIVLSSGGVFVSEFPPGTPARPGNFPRRNRILAALGRVTAVFEAAAKSGSLITASLASEQGCEVFCLPPGNIFDPGFSGNIMLLREGAVPLYSVKDILDCFRFGTPTDLLIRKENSTEVSSFGIDPIVKKEENPVTAGVIDRAHVRDLSPNEPADRLRKALKPKPEESAGNAEVPVFDNSVLTDIQKKITDTLSDGVLHADIIADKLEIEAAELMMELTELEIMGIVRSLPGKNYELC